MDILVYFFGSPLDVVTMTSDASDSDETHIAQRIAQVIGGCLHDAETREVTFDPDLTFTVPSEWMEKARREHWSDAKMAALVTRHEYKYSRHRELDGIAEIFMQFVESW